MTPDEVLDKLRELGVVVTRKTLLNYEAYNLPQPERGSGGRGIGRFTDYPPDTVEHAFAIYHMLNSSNYPSSLVMEISEMIPHFTDNPFVFVRRIWDDDYNKICNNCEFKESCEKTVENGKEPEMLKEANDLFTDWLDRNLLTPIITYLTYLFIVRYGIRQGEPVNMVFIGTCCYGVDMQIVNRVHILEYDDVLKDYKYQTDYNLERDECNIRIEEYTNKENCAKIILWDRITKLTTFKEIELKINKK